MAAPTRTDRPRTALVAGGGGALGQAVTRELLDRGERVCVPYIVDAEADALREAHPQALEDDRLRLTRADATDLDAMAAVLDVLTADWGDLWLACSVVGGFAGGTKVEDFDDVTTLERMLSLNVRSAFAVANRGLQAMGDAGGRLVLVGAAPALHPPAGLSTYAASKAAVHALVQSLGRELAGSGRTANAVAPTMIDTPGNRAAMPNADTSTWTPPEAIAEVIAWLASPEAWTVNGAIVPVPGNA